ncbi:hypothetical protein [Cytobacillus sp.]|uniref:hypothetical protein n=1 Tax=Cytobacillus sp. TaxID=2675269 RepID=UPI0028BDFA7A|nr:hypothetical protein [Cytobacillus sp.]
MNRRNTRAFAFGVLFSVCIIGIFYFRIAGTKVAEMNMDRAKNFLEDNGYVVLSKDKFAQIEKTLSTETNNVEKQQKPVTDPPKSEESVTAYQLEIVSGMVSRDIAEILAKEKIIDEADRFEIYLEENGYSKKIQLGSFHLTAKMSYKDIAKTITKS